MQNFDVEKYDLKIIDLKDFPHTTFNNHVEGKNGPIDFYNVKEGTQVLTLDESTNSYVWTKVKYWSVHPNRKLEIVTLANGLQIYTDDDPRAIYGIRKENLLNQNYIYERFTPSDALANNVLVPCKALNKLATIDINDIDWKRLNKEIKTFNDAKELVYELFKQGIIAEIHFFDGAWTIEPTTTSGTFMDTDTDLIYLSIKDVEKTNQFVEGYDLTVDNDNQTFMSATGIILSNTINIHVPSLPEAQKEIREKLLPSKQIYGIRNAPKKGKDGEPIEQEEVYNKLKQDLILGMYSANRAKAEKRWLFATKKEALEAIRSGKVKLSDEVEILEK